MIIFRLFHTQRKYFIEMFCEYLFFAGDAKRYKVEINKKYFSKLLDFTITYKCLPRENRS